MEVDPVAIEATTPEQVAEVIRLATVFNIDPEERLKWFEKAGVNSWGEMDGPTVQACIDCLRKRLAATEVA